METSRGDGAATARLRRGDSVWPRRRSLREDDATDRLAARRWRRYRLSWLRTPLACLPTPLEAALRRSNGAALPRDAGVDPAVRTGFVTLDETRRCVFLLETDPLAATAPLVGIFAAGFVTKDPSRAARDGAVVAAAAGFLARPRDFRTARVAKDCCLAVVFCAPARGAPAEPCFFELSGKRGAATEVLDFVCDVDAAACAFAARILL